MMSTRALGLGPAFRRAALSSKIARNQIALRAAFPKRAIQTQSLPSSASQEILDAQRVKRPSSPHFTIYQPQLTWIGSIVNRVTGTGLSVLLYGFTLSYLAAPIFGVGFSGADIVEVVSALPEGVKYAAKVVLAAPFAFHSWNGLRHLAWDSGKFLSIKGAYATGYVVLGATAVSTVALVLL